MIIRDEIWVLQDDRAGTMSQSVGLAQEIGFEYKIIEFSYNYLANLPNFILSSSLLRINCNDAKKIKTSPYFPRFVISAGRRSAPIALAIKKLSKNQTQVIQIMNPNIGFDKFDYVILPKHDEIDEHKNVLTTIGALSKVNEKKIKEEMDRFSSWFKGKENKKIALLIGGSSKSTEFEKHSAEKLAKLSSNIAKNMNANLIVLTSPRTGEEISNTIKEHLDCDHKFYDWPQYKEKNPYLATLGYCDYFIISGDSVSMISEVACLGENLYIFDEEKISSKKHRRFHENLINSNFAKKLTSEAKKLENFAEKKITRNKKNCFNN